MSGRPLGEIRLAMRQALAAQPMTVQHLAQTLQVSAAAARYSVSREVAAGTVLRVEAPAAGGRGRPGAVYSTAGTPPADSSLAEVWPRIVVLGWPPSD